METALRAKRTVLYYPTMSIPNGAWLRQALLYWDQVASIVPAELQESGDVEYTPDIRYLLEEGEFRPVSPELLFNSRDSYRVKWLEAEFSSLLCSEQFRKSLPLRRKRSAKIHEHYNPWRMHDSKVRHELVTKLKELGLVEQRSGDDHWYYFEQGAALLYMSLLAKYLADLDTSGDSMVPGTDVPQYSRLAYEPHSQDEPIQCLDIRFSNALPAPREDVPLDDILQFKRTRATELLNFRAKMLEFQRSLREAKDERDIRDVVADFKDSMQREVNTIGLLLKDSKIATFAQSVRSLMSVKSPAIWSGLAVAVGVAQVISNVPVKWILGGAALSGAVEVGCSWLDAGNRNRAQLAELPFAYLYYATQEKII